MLTSKFLIGKTCVILRASSLDGEAAPPHLNGLKIPPGWSNVQVETDPESPILATGFDRAGRQQYRYKPDFLAKNQDEKFANVRDLLAEWEDIRTQIERDVVNMSYGTREQQQAAIIALLIYETGIRPGSIKDTKAKVKAYGATTLLNRHIVSDGLSISLVFVGKKGVSQNVSVTNFWLRSMFQTAVTNGHPKQDRIFDCRESVLRKYFATLGSGKYTPKDFRTCRATSLAIELIGKQALPTDQKERKKTVKEITSKVASKLGNTAAVANKSYIDPAVGIGAKKKKA